MTKTIQDFEDFLMLLHQYEVQYLIVGGMAFIYHAKPRYTKDMDVWIEPAHENIERANKALVEFGSPIVISEGKNDEIIQIGVAPNRIDILLSVTAMTFQDAWPKRIESYYGTAIAHWIDLDSLIAIKEKINNPRHQEDVRVLKEVKKLRNR